MGGGGEGPRVMDWLLDREHSDPAIRWQVMRDLLDVPDEEWATERAAVETDGWGARLLALQAEDGQWDGGAHFPAGFQWGQEEGQPWTSTSHALSQLREFGLDPTCVRAQRAVTLIGENCRADPRGVPAPGVRGRPMARRADRRG